MTFNLIFCHLLVAEELTYVSWGGSDQLLEKWHGRDILNIQVRGDSYYSKLYLILRGSLSCLLFCPSGRDLHHYLGCNYAPSFM
jgi:hypothetical protein